jgi:hypothetical protein
MEEALMGLMRFFCCLLPGRCDTEPAKPEKRTPATSVPTDVQPNTTGPLQAPRQTPRIDTAAYGASSIATLSEMIDASLAADRTAPMIPSRN